MKQLPPRLQPWTEMIAGAPEHISEVCDRIVQSRPVPIKLLANLGLLEVGHMVVQSLTPRQTDILQLIAQGHDYKAVAEKLFISHQTVKFTLKEVYRRLGAKNATHAVAIALREGFIAYPEDERMVA